MFPLRSIGKTPASATSWAVLMGPVVNSDLGNYLWLVIESDSKPRDFHSQVRHSPSLRAKARSALVSMSRLSNCFINSDIELNKGGSIFRFE